jgi:hypothetical protein
MWYLNLVILKNPKSEFHIFGTRDPTLLALLAVLSVYLRVTYTPTLSKESVICNLKTSAIQSAVKAAKACEKKQSVTPSLAFTQNGLQLVNTYNIFKRSYSSHVLKIYPDRLSRSCV